MRVVFILSFFLFFFLFAVVAVHSFTAVCLSVCPAVRCFISLSQAPQVGLTLLSAAASSWSVAPVSLELGLSGQMFPEEPGTNSTTELRAAGNHSEIVLLLPWLLPVTLPSLLEKEPWTLVTGKVRLPPQL